MALDVGNMKIYSGERHTLTYGHYSQHADEFDAIQRPQSAEEELAELTSYNPGMYEAFDPQPDESMVEIQ